MDLVLTLMAGFSYAEICVVLLLVLPVASPHKWNRFFKSKFLAMVARRAYLCFFFVIVVLVLFLLEAIREMRKYSNQEHYADVRLNTEMQRSMRLFKAQRNFCISGFPIFLALVIRRLVTLISVQANLLDQNEATFKQAQSASAIIRSLMQDINTEKADEAKEDSTLAEITNIKERTQELTAELNREKKDKEDRNTEKADEAKEDSALAVTIRERIRELTAELNREKKNKKDGNTEKVDEAKEDDTLAVITKMKEVLHELTVELNRENKEKEALKSQAKSLNREYVRLIGQYSKFERQMNINAECDDKADKKFN
uniref:Endoplasmic reticulum transmembrane protein n=1 Tax=Glossina morsitans morsitans TaxID=37546 RepID=A0A1B0FH63_GLOMM